MQKRSFVAITFFILLIIAAHYVGWLNGIESFLRRVLNLESKVVYSWSLEINNQKEEFKNIAELENAYQKLKQKYLDNLVDETAYRLIEEENKSLRQQLNFFTQNNYEYVGATVVGKGTEPLRSVVVIDKGQENGINVGMPVVAENGIMVGKILSVDKKSSMVLLLNDQQSKVASTIVSKDKSVGILEGGYGLSIQMNFIPQNETVSIGESVITSGLEKEIPRGLLIGIVDAVEKEAYQPFQKAVVSPLINLDKIRLVSVILNYQN